MAQKIFDKVLSQEELESLSVDDLQLYVNRLENEKKRKLKQVISVRKVLEDITVWENTKIRKQTDEENSQKIKELKKMLLDL